MQELGLETYILACYCYKKAVLKDFALYVMVWLLDVEGWLRQLLASIVLDWV